MIRRLIIGFFIVLAVFFSGCAAVPKAPKAEDLARKTFNLPQEGFAGVYIFRNTRWGAAIKRYIKIDGETIGEIAPMTYLYHQVSSGKHAIATESEFAEYTIVINMESGKNYFISQYLKHGVFVTGTGLKHVSQDQGMDGVLECDLAAYYSEE